MHDTEYMRLALSLARRGLGFVNPNPLVGAVVVKDDTVIGQGWHERFGGLHAERNALKNCQSSPAGATLYVTLEPCCHQGKTPPCTEAILESGISRVVIGTLDPNPLMCGKSVALLREHHISVTVGVLEAECRELIRVFSKFITTGLPYVHMKYAMTMDGKIATHTGKSRWITGEEARRQVHRTRQEFSAILVGVNTVLCDDPALTCRLKGGRNPLRIICDAHLRTPLSATVVRTARKVPTLIATSCLEETRRAPYLELGCTLLEAPAKEGFLDLKALMAALGRQKVDSILLEGGGALNWSALKQQIVDEMEIYLAPKIFGGACAAPVGGTGVDLPAEAFLLKNTSVSQVGEDYRIRGEVSYPCLPES